jgi:hypothetical protein
MSYAKVATIYNTIRFEREGERERALEELENLA